MTTKAEMFKASNEMLYDFDPNAIEDQDNKNEDIYIVFFDDGSRYYINVVNGKEWAK